MMEYRVDLRDITSSEQLHQRLAGDLDLPAWYGGNLDALFDVLTQMKGMILVTGYPEAEKNLAEAARGFRAVCEDAAAENDDLRILFTDEETDDAEYGFYEAESEYPPEVDIITS